MFFSCSRPCTTSSDPSFVGRTKPRGEDKPRIFVMLKSEASARLADPSCVGRTKPRGEDKPQIFVMLRNEGSVLRADPSCVGRTSAACQSRGTRDLPFREGRKSFNTRHNNLLNGKVFSIIFKKKIGINRANIMWW